MKVTGFPGKKHQRGVAAVEMAIVVLPMLILCFGITELGRALYQYNGLVKATRGAARYLSQQNLASPPAGQTADGIRTNARSLALCGTFNCGDREPLVPNMTVAMISVCDPVLCPDTHANVATGDGTTSLVSVTIGGTGSTYAFQSLVPWVVPNINFSPVRITMAASTN
ncbi:TadE/TadG family type IV pilus assembly protein [Hydrogenophaga sp.]|uniref:TadE/TadG family type IV pilus assembly protein n=1 Tax=Hydrogenophaga sp. TaxID=1904254 RepID=UPI0027194906|nr:TadE/TadG family type IV pilus assembly protein [Hydrogenophaga sp.]MDO8905338.1 pilus assembly protein [Hydrogenophaga sp.]